MRTPGRNPRGGSEQPLAEELRRRRRRRPGRGRGRMLQGAAADQRSSQQDEGTHQTFTEWPMYWTEVSGLSPIFIRAIVSR